MLENGFYKVAENGFSTTKAIFFNPDTLETYSVTVWDNDDYRVEREHEVEYNERIDDDVRRIYLKHIGVISEGDMVEVYKGRKVPIGTKAKVVRIQPWYDNYHRLKANYAVLDNGMRTNINNCRAI